MLRLILLLGFNCLLSAAVVAFTVARSSELVERIEQALEKPERRGSVAAVWEAALQVSVAFLICGALIWRHVGHVPFG